MRLTAWKIAFVTVAAALSGAACSASLDEATSESADAVSATAMATLTKPVVMDDSQRKELVEKKATCPFVGAAVFLKKLDVRNSLINPLAKIDQIVALGDEGGGNLGRLVLKAFARGNHHRMRPIVRIDSGERIYGTELTHEIDESTGLFSLDFPPSQGSHPGHSGILESGEKGAYHGVFNKEAFDRLLGYAVDAKGNKPGTAGSTAPTYIKRSDLGAYIVANLRRDDDSVYLGHGFAPALAADVADLKREVLKGDFDEGVIVEKLVKLTGTNNLIGSAGEFALLMTLLEVPGKEVNGEPVVQVEDLKLMFRDKQLPTRWNQRPMTARSWVKHTVAIVLAAEQARF